MEKTAGDSDSERPAFHGLHCYLQDELGSPLRVSGYRAGKGIPECRYLTYGYDEFGNDAGKELEEAGIPNPYDGQGVEQPFGYTGYRHDSIGGTYFAQAREYRPEEGRFMAEDVVKGNVILPKTLNLYGYCHGNPLVFVDGDGKSPMIPMPVITEDDMEKLENFNDLMQVLKYRSKDNIGTVTLGVNISATPGFWQFDGLVGVSFDFRGNIALQVTGSDGVTIGTPSAAASWFVSVTNAPKITNLEEDGLAIGGSAILPSPIVASPSVGAEYNLVGDINNQDSEWYHGITLSEGIGFGAGGEGHIEWGYTKMTEPINIFSLWNDFYFKLFGITEITARKENECKN